MADDNELHGPTEHSANHTSRGLVIFVVVLACYFLSPIPIAWGLERLGVMDHFERVFEIVYAPLESLAERVEIVGKFYRWQIELVGL